MDIKIEADNIEVRGNYSGKKVSVILNDIDTTDLDNEDVAACIGINTFVEAVGMAAILDYFGKDAVDKHYSQD